MMLPLRGRTLNLPAGSRTGTTMQLDGNFGNIRSPQSTCKLKCLTRSSQRHSVVRWVRHSVAAALPGIVARQKKCDCHPLKYLQESAEWCKPCEHVFFHRHHQTLIPMMYIHAYVLLENSNCMCCWKTKTIFG